MKRMDIVGESHYQGAIRSVLLNNGREFVAIVKPEPNNQYDRNAIRICSPTNDTIGYLSKETAVRYKGHFDSGITTVPARITGGESGKEHLGVVLSWDDRSTDGASGRAVAPTEEAGFEVKGSTADESEIRERVESKDLFIEATVNWHTPSGKRRTAPIYEAEIANGYLNTHRTVKAKSTDELEARVRQVAEIWAEQETRKRIVDGKRDAKEHAQAEAQRLDQEAKEALADAEGLLAATLAIDDRIDWEAERDTRAFKRFSFPKPPQQPAPTEPPQRPAPTELVLPPEPGLAWLLRSRLRKWQAACEEKESLHQQAEAKVQKGWQEAVRLHQQAEAKVQQDWQEAVRQHEQAREEARKQHESDKAQFRAEQERSNKALVEFRRALEAGEVSAIVEYCSRVIERSQYPDWVVMSNTVGFDEESRFVVVELELPPPDTTPTTAGYRFVSRGNSVEPIPLKKKDAGALYESILDQLVLRTIHEVIEGCYIDTVKGVLLNGWVTIVNKATGNDSRKRLRSVVADRATFEALDLTRIDPASCIRHLSEGVGQIQEAGT